MDEYVSNPTPKQVLNHTMLTTCNVTAVAFLARHRARRRWRYQKPRCIVDQVLLITINGMHAVELSNLRENNTCSTMIGQVFEMPWEDWPPDTLFDVFERHLGAFPN